jgi:hypothetical protein
MAASQSFGRFAMQVIKAYSGQLRYSSIGAHGDGYLNCLCIRQKMVTGKSSSLQGWAGPLGSRNFRLPEFLDTRHMKEVKLSAEHIGRLYITAGTPGTHVCYRLSRSQGHSTNGGITLIFRHRSFTFKF